MRCSRCNSKRKPCKLSCGGGCGRRNYCSNECLRSDWHDGHYRVCQSLVEARLIGTKLVEDAIYGRIPASKKRGYESGGIYMNAFKQPNPEKEEDRLARGYPTASFVYPQRGSQCRPFLATKGDIKNDLIFARDSSPEFTYKMNRSDMIVTVAQSKTLKNAEEMNQTCIMDDLEIIYSGFSANNEVGTSAELAKPKSYEVFATLPLQASIPGRIKYARADVIRNDTNSNIFGGSFQTESTTVLGKLLAEFFTEQELEGKKFAFGKTIRLEVPKTSPVSVILREFDPSKSDSQFIFGIFYTDGMGFPEQSGYSFDTQDLIASFRVMPKSITPGANTFTERKPNGDLTISISLNFDETTKTLSLVSCSLYYDYKFVSLPELTP